MVKSFRVTATDDGFLPREKDPRSKALVRASQIVDQHHDQIAVIFDSRQPNPIGYAVDPSRAENQTGVNYNKYLPFLRKLYKS